MIEQLKTIREFIESVHEGEWAPYAGRYEALTAVSELERMAGEPVSHATVAGALFDFMGWLTSRRARLVLSSVDNAAPAADAIKEFAAMRGLSINDAQVQTWKEQLAAPPAQQPQYEAADMASAAAQGFRDGVASVAQQPHEIEVQCPVCNHKFYEWSGDQQPQARPDFTDEWTGYLKDGETPFERFLRERKDLNALTKLYQRAIEENERLKAQQPQAEPFGYVSQHTNGSWEFSPTPAGVYPDTAKSITAVYTKQPQTEAVPDFESHLREIAKRAITQQAETVPSDVVRMDWIAMHGSFGVDSVTGLPGGNGQKRIAATRAAIDTAMAQGANHG